MIRPIILRGGAGTRRCRAKTGAERMANPGSAIIEVQVGGDLCADDIERLEDDYGR